MGAIPSGRVGNVSPNSPPKGRIWGDLGGAAAGGDPWTTSGRGRVRQRKGEWGRGGRRGPRTLVLSRQPAWRDRLVAPVQVARQGGPRHRRRCAGSGRQRGHTVAPHALARQRLSVAPEPVSRPNGLRPTNKKQYGLNLKCY